MKKILLGIIITASTNIAVASSFDGFYIGAGIGGTNANIDTSQTVTLQPVDTTTGTPLFSIVLPHNAHITGDSFAGNFDAGWGKVFRQKFYLGLELNDTIQDIDASDVMNVNEVNSMLAIGTKTQVELNNELSLTLNPGILFHQNTLLYGKIGPAWGHFDSNSSANYSQAIFSPIVISASTSGNADNSYETGLRLGIGMEHLISDHFSLRLEYDHTNYGHIDDINSADAITVNDPLIAVGGEITNNVGISADDNQILFSVNYRFG